MNHQNEIPKSEKFLWTLAGYNPEIIKNCAVDKFHVIIISLLLILVGIYATLAWTFFFTSVTHYLPIAIIGGLFMGIFIVAFDRALIASMAGGNTSIFSLGFRFFLAIILGVFLSQPMIHKIYEPEIKREAQILMDQKVLERKDELGKIYASEIEHLETQKTALQNQLDAKLAALNTSEADFKAEMDGSAGTGKYGYSVVAKQKEKIFKKYETEYAADLAVKTPQIKLLQDKIDAFETKITDEIATYQSNNLMIGTLLQAEALKSLMQKDKSNTLRNHFYLLSLILILIELSALIAKLIFRTKSYEAQIDYASVREINTTTADKEILLAKLARYQSLTTYNEIDVMENFYSKAKDINDEQLDGLLNDYSNNKTGTFNGYWKLFEDKFFVHR
jgi:hypothetical protein